MNEFQQAYDSARSQGPEAWQWCFEEGEWVATCPYTDGLITSAPGTLEEGPVAAYRRACRDRRKREDELAAIRAADPDDYPPF